MSHDTRDPGPPDLDRRAMFRATQSDILDAEAVALLLGKTPRGALKLMQRGELGPYGPLGRKTVVLRESMLAYLAQKFARQAEQREREAGESKAAALRATEEEQERADRTAMTREEKRTAARRKRLYKLIGEPSEESIRALRGKRGGA